MVSYDKHCRKNASFYRACIPSEWARKHHVGLLQYRACSGTAVSIVGGPLFYPLLSGTGHVIYPAPAHGETGDDETADSRDHRVVPIFVCYCVSPHTT